VLGDFFDLQVLRTLTVGTRVGQRGSPLWDVEKRTGLEIVSLQRMLLSRCIASVRLARIRHRS